MQKINYIVEELKRKYKKGVKFEKIAQEWLEYKKIEVKESTYYNYKYIIEKYLNKEFGSKYVKRIRDYNQFVISLSKDLKPKTVRDIVNVLKAILNYYEKEYNKNFNYKQIKVPKIEKSNVKILTSRERKRLERYCLSHLELKELGIVLALNTGMRVGEICALKWENIDLSEKSIYVKSTLQRVYDVKSDKYKKTKIIIEKPKTRSSIRTVPINNKIYDILYPLKNKYSKKAFLITGSEESFFEPRRYQYEFKSILKNAKIKPYKFHILRHTFATNCIEVGMDVKSLSEILGHSKIDITLNTYVHSSRQRKKMYLEKL